MDITNDTRDAHPLPAEGQPQAGSSWLDLVLYLAIFAGFFAATVVVGLAFRNTELSIGLTALILAMNCIFFAGGVYVLGVLRGKLSLAELGLWPIRWQWQWLLIAIAISLVFIPLRIMAAAAAQFLVEGGMASAEARSEILLGGGSPTWFNFIITLIGAGLLVPLAEELYFRGAIYTWCRRRYAVWIAVAISSAFFALAHADSAGAVASSLILGVLCAVMFEYTKSIWMSFALHMLTNVIAIVLLYGLLALTQLFPALQGLQ